MPELPEVEFASRHLRRWLLGKRIERVEADRTRIVRPHRPEQIAQALTGRTLQGIDRRAKYILLSFDEGQGALSHLGMTGKWVLRKEGQPERFSRLRLHLRGGGVVHYADPRMFGQFQLVPQSELRAFPAVAALGPDPLGDGLDAKLLGERLARTSREVKVALMDQKLLSGLGNIHAAEALYRAKIDPKKRANALSKEQLSRLAKAIHATIAHALKAEDEQASDGEITYVEEGGPNPFLVYGRKGERCPRCKGTIASFTQAGRTTYWCPGCQKK
jgi:formamidopyrimidine-DNA glycosylase